MNALNITDRSSLVLAYASDKITLATYNRVRVLVDDQITLATEIGVIGVGLITAENNAIAYAMRPFIANREALARLLKWLDAGAHGFDMNTGISFTEEGKGKCGTTCCIGGAVAQMSLGIWDKEGTVTERHAAMMASAVWDETEQGDCEFDQEDKMYGASFWGDIPKIAIEHLGIEMERLGEQRHYWMGLDLFDNDLAPARCTPAQAAQAVRNFDATGEPMWDTV
jgi:hypothetical protein